MAGTHDTLSSEDGPDGPGSVTWLCCVGSPEDGFRGAGIVVPLQGIDRIELGRASEASPSMEPRDRVLEVRIPLRWVSGAHASVQREDAGWVLQDLGSKNGTFADGLALTGPHVLRAGEVFEIGRSFWAIESGPDAPVGADASGPDTSASPALRRALGAVGRLVKSDVPVLLQGETGTGKSRLARWIHARSERSGPLVVVDLAAGSIERQLLGGRGGTSPLVEAAGGTLLLDDVGELDLPAQTELLSVLLGRVPRTAAAPGGPPPRVIATSVRDLQAAVVESTFRADLLSRLSGYALTLPPLRRRRADLGRFAQALCRDPGGAPVQVSIEAFRQMLRSEWPFNLRQLEHTLRAATAVAGSGCVTADVLRRVAWETDAATTLPRLAAVRHELLRQLSRHEGRLDDVATALGCAREDVERWVERFAREGH
jgi:transcriptional regulator of acetoin/glycerol metabolism